MSNFRQIDLSDTSKADFARKAAKHFEDNPLHNTYGDIKPDSYFALRWGLSNDCILVFKISDEEPIDNYVQIIDRDKSNQYTEAYRRLHKELSHEQ